MTSKEALEKFKAQMKEIYDSHGIVMKDKKESPKAMTNLSATFFKKRPKLRNENNDSKEDSQTNSK